MLSNLAKIKQIQQLNEKEIEYNIKPTGSWHMKVRIILLIKIIIAIV